jgi:hypothetical protein
MIIETTEGVPDEAWVKSVSDTLYDIEPWKYAMGIALEKPVNCCCRCFEHEKGAGAIHGILVEKVNASKGNKDIYTDFDKSDIKNQKHFVIPVCQDHIALKVETQIKKGYLVDLDCYNRAVVRMSGNKKEKV